MKIFLCCDPKDASRQKRIEQVLNETEHSILDMKTIVVPQDNSTYDNWLINECDVLLYFVTEATVNSVQHNRFRALAFELGKSVVNLYFDEVSLPTPLNDVPLIDLSSGVDRVGAARLVTLLTQIKRNNDYEKSTIAHNQSFDSDMRGYALNLIPIIIPSLIAIQFYMSSEDLYIPEVIAVIIGLIVIVASFVLTKLIVFISPTLKKHPVSTLVISSVIFTIFGFFVVNRIIVGNEKPTWIFIVDATEQSTEIFQQQILNWTRLNTTTLTTDVNDIGLIFYGGEMNGNPGCSDISELVEPLPKFESLPLIQSHFSNLEHEILSLSGSPPPRGIGSIQESVIFALSRLQKRRGRHGIVIITSGINNGCDNVQPLDRAMVNSEAEQYRYDFHIRILVQDCTRLTTEAMESFLQFADIPPCQNDVETTDIAHEIVNIVNTSPSVYFHTYYGQYYEQ